MKEGSDRLGRLILVLGGARSGKSRYAERLAACYDTVTYLATGAVTDAEMADRIARHRAERPAHWRTVEEGYHPAAAVRDVRGVVLLDCVSFLASNHLLRDEEGCEEALMKELEALADLDADVIAVSNEVGMGVVPEHRLGRLFRDVLGRANQYLAARAEQVFVCFAGIPVDVKRLADRPADVPGDLSRRADRSAGSVEGERMSKNLGVAKDLDRGLILINTGDGKGKSTAAFGTVVRAVGQGLKPIVIQFVKGNWRTGEQKAMEILGVEMHQMGYGFMRFRPSHKTEEEHFAQMQGTFDFAREKAATGAYDLMVLDEINVAIALGGLDPAAVIRWLQAEKPTKLHVFLTGRGAPQALIEAADLVTEMRLVKHHFQAGIGAVRGLEF